MTNEEKKICYKYASRDKDGDVHCSECPLIVDKDTMTCKRDIELANKEKVTMYMSPKEAMSWLKNIKDAFHGNCTTDTMVPISRCDVEAITVAINTILQRDAALTIMNSWLCDDSKDDKQVILDVYKILGETLYE